jgi:protein-S-isoprenylcysteine O-methyltransferase Ste14
MLMTVRQLVSIVALPCTVAVAIPIWIARRNGVSLTAPQNLESAVVVFGGVGLLLVGFALFAASVFYFWSRGRGTLAPWDPPHQFVVDGPYRFVRNPMISGVIFVLLGEALVLRSRPHAEWAGLFALINALYIPILEEPMLAARFGDPYRRYTRAVRRFVPHLRPWNPHAS